jgi:hypothetical protein
MPARTHKIKHSQRDKDRIRASQLLNRLEAFVNGKIKLSSAQVQAARVLIGKVIPDLKSVEVTGDPDKPVEMNRNLIVQFVTPPSRPHE